MKKNIFSDKENAKGSKGFYAALGISVVMIGSACFFAYNEGEKLNEDNYAAKNSSSVSEEAVDKKYTGEAKTTAAVTTRNVITTTVAVTSQTATADAHIATIPAAEIVVGDEPETVQSNNEVTAAAETTEVSAKLENVKTPLADISNILNPFSGSELVKNETTGSWQTHNGTDIAAEIGTEVYAISNGEITAVNDDPLWGTVVVVDHHNGYISRYCGLAKDLSVQAGDTVVSGDVLGFVGDTADIESALSPHLHIEITHNGNYEDPLSLIPS